MRYYSRAELDLSPSRRAGMDAKKETQFRWAACELIKDTGMRLKVPQLTIATATVFCHRFYALNSHTRVENDWQQVSAACLFLAGKVEETPKALRDVVSMAYLLRHRKEQDKAQEAIKNKDLMAVEGEKLLAAERHLLHTLGFEFTVTHPYMSLNLAVKKIRALSASAGEPVQAAARAAGASEEAVAEALAATPGVVGVESTREIFQVAWNFINDSLRTTLSLQYDAKSIAAAVLYLAARFKKTRLPDVGSPEGARWWDAVFGFPVSLGVCEEIGNQILDLYQQSGKTMLAEAGLQRAPPQAASAPAAAAAGDSAAPPVPREARADVAAALRAPSAPAGAPGPPPVKREGGEHGERDRARERERERDHRGGGGGGGGGERRRSRERSRSRERDGHRRRSRSRDRRRSRSRDRASPRRRESGSAPHAARNPPPPDRRASEGARAAAAAAAQAALAGIEHVGRKREREPTEPSPPVAAKAPRHADDAAPPA